MPLGLGSTPLKTISCQNASHGESEVNFSNQSHSGLGTRGIGL
jgi:hypothetical protein